MKLMGVDVGFSTTRATTGIACLDGDHLCVARAKTEWESRRARIPGGFQPTLIALDGPLLPQGNDELIRRPCELIFSHSPFHNRCKPGLSHCGWGLELRRASARACVQFSRVLAYAGSEKQKALVRRDGPLVEAFPNAFLGVLMPEEELLSAPKMKRGQRFDWLYERVVRTGRLEHALSKALILPDKVWHHLNSETDHEVRAALICLLTAALAVQGAAAVIGETTGGWFWLPPRSLWEPWAFEGLKRAATAMALRGHSLDDFLGA
jgi:hypothetical protein